MNTCACSSSMPVYIRQTALKLVPPDYGNHTAACLPAAAFPSPAPLKPCWSRLTLLITTSVYWADQRLSQPSRQRTLWRDPIWAISAKTADHTALEATTQVPADTPLKEQSLSGWRLAAHLCAQGGVLVHHSIDLRLVAALHVRDALAQLPPLRSTNTLCHLAYREAYRKDAPVHGC